MTVIDQFPRRAFLRGLVALGAAGLVARPAIVRASSLDLATVRHASQGEVAEAIQGQDWIKHGNDIGRWETGAIRIDQSNRASVYDGKAWLPLSGVFNGEAYNQRSGLWETGLNQAQLAARNELLTDSMPRGEWMRRRAEWVIRSDCDPRPISAHHGFKVDDVVTIISPKRTRP